MNLILLKIMVKYFLFKLMNMKMIIITLFIEILNSKQAFKLYEELEANMKKDLDKFCE